MVLRSALLLALTIGLIGAVDLPEGPARAQGIGSPSLVLEPKNGKTSLKHPALANNSFAMFCGAKQNPDDLNYLPISRVRWSKFPTPDSTNLTEAMEVDFEKTEPASNNTVSVNFEHPNVTTAGKYRCDLWQGDTFLATGNLMIHMRPVFIQEDNVRLDVNDDAPFDVDGGGYTVTEGDDVTLSCRALGNPEPKYQWEKDGKPLKSSKKYSIKNHILNITSIGEEDRSFYRCNATNSFMKDGREQTFTTSVTYNVRIRSKLAWLWPLLAIIITAILLALIIITCEYRRKKRERETRGLEPEEDD